MSECFEPNQGGIEIGQQLLEARISRGPLTSADFISVAIEAVESVLTQDGIAVAVAVMVPSGPVAEELFVFIGGGAASRAITELTRAKSGWLWA